ncbi:MAG TPA: hypothetical protein DCS93_18265 [Microscillaceae bacterium]|nr:hypothetical protein [Microscillaceae bacterium]
MYYFVFLKGKQAVQLNTVNAHGWTVLYFYTNNFEIQTFYYSLNVVDIQIMKHPQKDQELWQTYPRLLANEEKFWKKYDKLKQEALRLRTKHIQNPLVHAQASQNFITNVFLPDQGLKSRFRQKLLRAKIKSMATICGALGAFTYLSLWVFSLKPILGHLFLGGCVILFAGTTVINYINERTLANTKVELQPFALLRKGKGLKTISIRYEEIVDLEEDEMGLYIKKKGMQRGSHYQYEEQDTIIIPAIVKNYDQLKQLLITKWKRG